MPMVEDFSTFFDAEEHGTVATYNSNPVGGIFEDQFVEVNGVESVKPTFLCAEADVPAIAHGDVITINSVGYLVAGDQPDGTGLILIILRVP